MKKLVENKKVKFDYNILETYSAGIVLFGHEVKAIRNNQMSLKGAYVSIHNGELWLKKATVSLYKKSGPIPNYDPERERKLLLTKKEIASLAGKLKQKGLTLVPLSVYTKNNRLKVEIGLAQGKKKYDKRESIKKRENDRNLRKKLSY